jgi:hypothetical protein
MFIALSSATFHKLVGTIGKIVDLVLTTIGSNVKVRACRSVCPSADKDKRSGCASYVWNNIQASEADVCTAYGSVRSNRAPALLSKLVRELAQFLADSEVDDTTRDERFWVSKTSQ